MEYPKEHLAKTLKDQRKKLGLSLDKAAELTGVSKAMLGQIERGESSPTVAKLWNIATGLGVSLSSFLEEPQPPLATSDVRIADDIRKTPPEGGLLVAPLFPYEERFGFEYMELTFQPGYERLSEPHEPGVVEIMTVTSGSLEILSEGQWHRVGTGQSLRYAGDKEHGYRNKGEEDAVCITVISYPNRPQS